jgi:hypothetical protein
MKGRLTAVKLCHWGPHLWKDGRTYTIRQQCSKRIILSTFYIISWVLFTQRHQFGFPPRNCRRNRTLKPAATANFLVHRRLPLCVCFPRKLFNFHKKKERIMSTHTHTNAGIRVWFPARSWRNIQTLPRWLWEKQDTLGHTGKGEATKYKSLMLRQNYM